MGKIIVLIAGNAGDGKDTLGSFLLERLSNWTSVRRDTFAYTIKLITHQTLGTPWHQLEGDRSLKENTRLRLGDDETGLTIRAGFQSIGEFFRTTFDKRIWANSVRLRALNAPERITVVTDCRHPDEEIHWMRTSCEEFANIYVVRVRNPRVQVKRGHPSEDLIADAPDDIFDFIVDNSGKLDDLREVADQLARAIVLLEKSNKRRVSKIEGWVVSDPEGREPYEPLLTEQEAKTIADSNNWRMSRVVISALRGARV